MLAAILPKLSPFDPMSELGPEPTVPPYSLQRICVPKVAGVAFVPKLSNKTITLFTCGNGVSVYVDEG